MHAFPSTARPRPRAPHRRRAEDRGRHPDTAKEKPQEGEVVAVGEGKYREDGTRQTLDVKPGDRVLFGKYSGSEVKLDDQEFLIMREDEILGIIQRAAAGKKGK